MIETTDVFRKGSGLVTYVAYLDDSGDETTAVYTALLIPIERWSACLRHWLDFRRNLYDTYGIPASYELHATEFISGKGVPAPSLSYGVNTDRGKRRKVLNLAAASIGALEAMRVVSKVIPHATPAACYKSILAEIDRVMVKEDGWCMIVIDGDGSQSYQKAAHRELKLSARRIIEDPWHQESHLSQFVQMADIASYTVFQAHSLRPSRRFMWGWMKQFLHKREAAGCCSCPVV